MISILKKYTFKKNKKTCKNPGDFPIIIADNGEYIGFDLDLLLKFSVFSLKIKCG